MLDQGEIFVFALGVFVLNVEHAECAIGRDREQRAVVVADAHAGDRQSMGLHLVSFLEGVAEHLDRARLLRLIKTNKYSLTLVHQHNLAHTSLVLIPLLKSELRASSRELLDSLIISRAVEGQGLVRLLPVGCNTGQLHVAQFPLPDRVRLLLGFLTRLRLGLTLILLFIQLFLSALGQAELP